MHKKILRLFAFLIIIVFVSGIFVSFAFADPPSDDPPQGTAGNAGSGGQKANISELLKSTLTGSQKKLSTELLQLTDDKFLLNGKTKNDLINEMKQRKQIKMSSVQSSISGTPEAKVHVYIKLKKGASFDILSPFEHGQVNRDSENRFEAAWVSIDSLESIASLDGVQSVREVIPPAVHTGSIVSQGDSVLKAFDMRAQTGCDGTGVKVGIISDGVDHWAESKATGDLPADFTEANILRNLSGGDEGTAMMEIVYDLAPGAELYFRDAGEDVIDFNDGIDELVNAGCNIICDDIGWRGEPYFEDGTVAQHITNVLATKNIIYVTAAGNNAEGHFQGMFYNDGYSYNDFSRGTDSYYQSLYADIPAGGVMLVMLQWDERFGQSSSDYDLYLSYYYAEELVSYSIGVQDGDEDPIEALYYYNPEEFSVRMQIDVYKAPLAAAKTLELFMFGCDPVLNNTVPLDSIYGHAAVPGVLTCGAVDQDGPTTAESYSSCGPVTMLTETRQKPEICGVDGVAVTGVGGFPKPFYGTSAAAPHIAAIAALLKSRFPAMSNEQIKSMLVGNANDIGTPGFDYVSGYGRANALNAALSSLYVTFDSQGGSAVSTQLVTRGQKAAKPADPKRTGYTFGGWYTNTDFITTHLWDFNSAVTADTRLYAKWTLNAFTVSADGTYDLRNYGSDPTIYINSGLTVTLTTGNTACNDIQIVCGGGVTLTADNLTITSSSYPGSCPISFAGSGNSLILANSSRLESGAHSPAILVEQGAFLSISGTGSLYASSGTNNNAAAIGGRNGSTCGDITVAGGDIDVNGGNGAGIGGGAQGGGGNITITGGTIDASAYTGAGIGGGWGGPGGNISITGGTVFANSGSQCDIGHGLGGSDGTLSISGDSAVIFKHNNLTPETAAHILVSTNIITDNIVFGRYEVPNTWAAPVYAYLDPTDLCYIHYNGLITGTETAPYYKGTTAKLKSNFTSGGQYIAGWNTEESGAGITYVPGTALTVTGDMDFYAIWGQMFGGSGTQADPYRIGSAQQLCIFAQLIDSGNTAYKGKYYTQTADINLSSYAAWLPIGKDYSHSFTGAYDGNGKKITGINVSILNQSSPVYAGLFGNLKGIINNLEISGGSVSASGMQYVFAGGIAGYMDSATVQNCRNSAGIFAESVNSRAYAGGVTGYTYGNCIINGCTNTGSISTSGPDNSAGGIAGELYGTQVSGCENSGDVCAQGGGACAGGIAGTQDSGVRISGCSNSGNVCVQDCSSAYAGGIAGYSPGLTSPINSISSCGNSGGISVKNSLISAYCGGIAGYAYCSGFMDCSNSGGLSAYNIEGSLYCGGISGICATNVSIIRCGNSGDILTENPAGACNFGGVAGSTLSSLNVSITECYSTGDISILSSANRVCSGGIIGYASSANISKCYNTGDLRAVSPENYTYSGGIIGYSVASSSSAVNLSDCFSNGGVSVSNNGTYSSHTGGIIGYGNNSYINAARCYNSGLITGGSYCGGFAGYISGLAATAFTNCYYINTCLNGIGSGIGTATGETREQMKQQAAFPGFDFTNTWSIVEGQRFPVLKDVPFAYVTGVSLPIKLGLDIGQEKKLVPVFTPLNASNKNLTWESSDPSVVSADNDGLVKLLADGSATVTVRADDGGFTASCNVLTRVPVSGVTLDNHTLQIVHHETAALAAAVLPADATYPEVTWTSSDESVATVDQSGNVTAVSVGNAVITAKAETSSDSCSVEVLPKHVTSVTLNSNTLEVAHRASAALTATVLPADATYPEVTWSSSNESAAKVDQNGNISALYPGTAVITAEAEGISDSCEVTVTPNFIVTFDPNGGSAVADADVLYGERITRPEDPLRTGYDFAGWFEDSGTFQNEWDFTTDTMPYGDLSLYAKWDPKYYTVTFNPAGGSVTPASKQVPYERTYGELPVPIRTGCYFFGWYTGTNGSGTLVEADDTVDFMGDVTLYARWVSNSLVTIGTPSLTVKAANYKTITLTWKAVASAKGYEVYKKTGSVYTRIAVVANGLGYIDTDVSAGTYYYYKIRAYHTPYLTTVYSGYSYIKYAKPAWPALSLKASSLNYKSVALDWNDVAGADKYEVYRNTSYSGNYTRIGIADVSTYTDNEGLTTGKTYYYKIRPFDETEGDPVYGPYSGYKYAKPAWPALSLKASSLNYKSVALDWNDIAGADKYEVWRNTTYSGTYTLVGTADVSTYTDSTGLTTGKTYYYKIRPFDETEGDPVYGAYSSYKYTKPAWPALSLKASSLTYMSIALDWNDIAGADKYEVWRNTTYSGNYTLIDTVDVSTYTDNTGLTVGKTYYYKIRPFDETEGGPVYGPYSSYKYAKPAWPALSLKASSLNYTSVALDWNDIAGADKYEVWRNTTYSGAYTLIGTVDVSTYTDSTGLTIGKTYYYKIRPFDETGGDPVYGPYSGYKYAKPAWPALSLKAESGGYDSIVLDWNDIAGADKYEVYRNSSYSGTYTLIYTADVSNYTDTGLTTGKTYYYKIRPFDENEGDPVYGPYSIYKYAKPVPAAPAGPTLERTSAISINISWGAVEGAAGYEVYRATSLNGTYTRIGAADKLTYGDIGLYASRIYYYKVRAYTMVGTVKVYGPYSVKMYM